MRVALVTGANRGLGLEVARQLLQRGDKVLLGTRSQGRCDAADESLRAEGLEPEWLCLDVTDPTSLREARDHIEREFGRLDVLVNNAAIHYDEWQTVTSVDFEVVEQAFATNTVGPWRMVQEMLPLFRRSEVASVVNVSSGAGAQDSLGSGTPAYSVSKLALNGLTRMLAKALPGISVNAVCPGWTATDMGGKGGRPVAEGARGIVWASDLKTSGGFYLDGEIVEW